MINGFDFTRHIYVYDAKALITQKTQCGLAHNNNMLYGGPGEANCKKCIKAYNNLPAPRWSVKYKTEKLKRVYYTHISAKDLEALCKILFKKFKNKEILSITKLKY